MMPKPLEEIYGARFFARRHRLNWRAPIVCGAIKKVFNPESVIDVGCATGDLVAEFLKMGIAAKGIEGSKECLQFLECDAEKIFIRDMRYPMPPYMYNRWDLTICFEVIEHIEPEFARQFVYNISYMSNRLLISAAPPGQGGHYHVNCRPLEYWDGFFESHGCIRNQDLERQLKEILEPWKNKPGIKAYYQNLLYFER